jgi:hypothetical protein
MPDERRCVLCGRDVQACEAAVHTSDGGIAHVVCGDTEAVHAWKTRRRWAVAHGAVLLIAIVALSMLFGPNGWIVVLAIGGAVLHILAHRRFWHFALRDLRRWWNPSYLTGRTNGMANLLRATITITGVRPLLWNRFGPDTIPASGKKERTGVAGNDPEEWRRSVLMTSERQLYLDPAAIFGCLRDAARYTPRKRGTLQPWLASTLQVESERILVDRYLPDPLPTDPEQPVYLDIRSVRNPATRARNVRYRVAAAPGWKATFEISWDRTIVGRDELKAVVVDAGRFIGLGDGRSIGLGRVTCDPDHDIVIREAAL